MSKTIEYRVRAVTRYVVTRHDGEHTSSTGEFDTAGKADTVATALADQEAGWEAKGESPRRVFALPYAGPLPGKVMRCKVLLYSRSQAYARAETDAEGKPPGRFNEKPWSYERGGQTISGVAYTPDPTDPANIVLDGEQLLFAAICPPSCDPDGAEENLIFGQYTPNFNLSAHVRNNDVLAALEQGAAYYVDFTPAPKVTPKLKV